MGLEAVGITSAMHFLRVGRGVLALPVHDSLIVPVRAVAMTRDAFGHAFHAHTRALVRTKVQ